MEKFLISGGNRINGSVKINRAKNALLPIIASTIIVNGKCFLKDFPTYSDTETMLEIIEKMGGKYVKKDDGVLIDTSSVCTGVFPADLFKRIRASVFMLGAIISKIGYAKTVLPGGCCIGKRPIDIHIDGLKSMGVKVKELNDYLEFKCDKLIGAVINLPFPSVGATENLIIAATLASGQTVIRNAAREPEIVDLANFLNKCGAKISGAGKGVITIDGVKKLYGTEYCAIPDRIEAGTFLLATMLLGGESEIKGCGIQNILAIINKTENSACKIHSFNDKIYIKTKGSPKFSAKIKTAPFPGFPTDIQSQTAALLCVADGTSVITDTIFPSRFGYVKQMNKLGANIRQESNKIIINGVSELHQAEVFAEDLRGGAGLTLACLKAEGVSLLHGVEHIDRGYDAFEKKLYSMGLKIKRIK